MKLHFFLILGLGLLACNQNKDSNDVNDPSTDTTGKSQNNRQDNAVNPYAGVDVSPMDMSYYPPNYPQQRMNDSVRSGPLARIIYSRPHLAGRKLFVDVLKYGEPWRLGANEATELNLFRDATIQGQKIKAGRYVLYCIPEADHWTIRLNTNIDSWGLKPDPAKDMASFTVPVTKTEYHIEYFTLLFEEKSGSGNILMAWDNLETRLPISF